MSHGFRGRPGGHRLILEVVIEPGHPAARPARQAGLPPLSHERPDRGIRANPALTYLLGFGAVHAIFGFTPK